MCEVTGAEKGGEGGGGRGGVRVVIPWWAHSPKGLETVDIHPDGTRVVTGGSGDPTVRLNFWNMACMRDPGLLESTGQQGSQSPDPTPKLLCVKELPSACIYSVRWNSCGSLLAAAADEEISIWCHSGKAPLNTFGSKATNLENWKLHHNLKGHQGNVFDVRWDWEDKFLASCSADNKIIIWNAKNFPQKYKILSGHSNLVKGVCWDPFGYYLASQGDDKSVRIWRTHDWKEERKISRPFPEAAGTTHFLRCDWSPDGQTIVCPQATNNEGPVACLINRDKSLSIKFDLAGHRKSVTCVRFHPCMLRVKNKEEVTQIFAVASKDRSVSIWMTGRRRAICYTDELLDDEITDLSWSRKALDLACTSVSGKIAFVFIETSLVGSLLSAADQSKLLKSEFSKILRPDIPQTVIENADILPYLNLNKENLGENFLKKTPSKPTGPVSTIQVEMKAKDGKRRITPVCLEEAGDDDEPLSAPVPFALPGATSSGGSGSGSGGMSPHNQVSTTTPEVDSNEQNLNLKLSGGFISLPAHVRKQQEEELKALPLSSSDVRPDSSSRPVQKVNASKTQPSESSNQALAQVKEAAKKEKKAPAKQKKRKLLSSDEETEETKKLSPPQKKKKKRPVAVLSTESGDDFIDFEGDQSVGYLDQHEESNMSEDTSRGDTSRLYEPLIIIPLPKVQKKFTLMEQNATINVMNFITLCEPLPITLHKLVYSGGANPSAPSFTAVASSPITCATCSQKLVSFACEDLTVHVFDTSGVLLVNPFVVDNKISLLRCQNSFVLAVTCEMTLSLWEIEPERKSTIFYNSQLTFLFNNPQVKFNDAYVTNNGIPVVVCSDQKAYAYDTDLKCWELIQDGNMKVTATKAQTRVFGGALRHITELMGGPPAHMSKLQNLAASNQEMTSLSNNAMFSYYKLQEKSAMLMKSPHEYKQWLLELVDQLANGRSVGGGGTSGNVIGQGSANERHLRRILEDLSKPHIEDISTTKKRSSSLNDSTSSDSILGMKKKDVLKECLGIVAKNVTLQRLFGEFNQLMKNL